MRSGEPFACISAPDFILGSGLFNLAALAFGVFVASDLVGCFLVCPCRPLAISIACQRQGGAQPIWISQNGFCADTWLVP